jgi:predicted nuclease of restriction endonuclease-like (RecB) superfamily
MQVFSLRNLQNIRKFYLFYSQFHIIAHQLGAQLQLENSAQVIENQQAAIGHQVGDQLPFPVILGEIPWRHHIEIMSHCKNVKEALFYVNQTIENGWSRAVLLNFLDSGLYNRQGKAVNNFTTMLPKTQSDLAGELLKDPYQFDFLMLRKDYNERELENALTQNITQFLLELGRGFAYVGRQIPMHVGEKEFFLDLLFYHLELCCYFVIELKAGEFNPADIGQLGFYVSAVNHQKKKETDNPTIGLLICKTKDNIVAQYALESSTQPIGISEYDIAHLLPENYRSSLPSIEEIEDVLNDEAANEH